jgi:glycerate dehydrogenase
MLLEPMPQALKGSTMGIIGYGAVGRSVARIAEGFGMNVVVAERRGAAEIRPDRVRFDRVLESSDILVVLCPLTPETAGLIGEAELSRMRPGALLINCARGGIVDDAALADALEQGRIAGAGVDVLSKEPPPADHPLLRPDLPNLVVTPHVAWASVQSLESLAEQLIGNLEAFAAGDPRNVVT